MCLALSGCCPIVVTVALGVPGAKVQAHTKSPVDMKAPVTRGVMSDNFSGLANKWMDSSPKARANVRQRGRRMTVVIGTGKSVTFDPLVKV